MVVNLCASVNGVRRTLQATNSKGVPTDLAPVQIRNLHSLVKNKYKHVSCEFDRLSG